MLLILHPYRKKPASPAYADGEDHRLQIFIGDLYLFSCSLCLYIGLCNHSTDNVAHAEHLWKVRARSR